MGGAATRLGNRAGLCYGLGVGVELIGCLSMKISHIKQQAKRADRYSIFVDEKYAFSLSESALLSSGLFIGQELTKDQLADLKDSSTRDKAYNQALGQLARRPRSEWEVRDYLKRKDYDPELINEVVGRLYKVNLLNDAEFARMWVDNRRLLKSTSQRRLQMELRQKRVADEVIQQTLANDPTDERQVLSDLIARKRKIARFAADDQKLMAYLIRQGFSYEDVKDAMRSLPTSS